MDTGGDVGLVEVDGAYPEGVVIVLGGTSFAVDKYSSSSFLSEPSGDLGSALGEDCPKEDPLGDGFEGPACGDEEEGCFEAK